MLNHTDVLRSLTINDPRSSEDLAGMTEVDPRELDAKTLALVRFAALVAVGGAVPSYGAQADAAVSAGATAAEIVDVLVSLVPIIGLPRVVAAAPKVAMALGYASDEEADLEPGL
jgi:4-carboxymuconolactone decarboxylase